MGGACCRCYKEETNETKVEQSIISNNGSGATHQQAINSMHSVSSSPPTAQNDGMDDSQNGSKSEDVSIDKTRHRVIEFYKVHNPQKLKDFGAIDEVLRRYKGRETKLFADLERKYVTSKEKAMPITTSNDKENDDGMKQINKTHSMEDSYDDENRPLNKKKENENDALSISTNNNNKMNNDNKQKPTSSPSSPSNRKISKVLLGSESPPDSRSDDNDDEILQHPILNDMDHSES